MKTGTERPYRGPSFFSDLRQLLYPREFRIARGPWPDDLIQALEALARAVSAPMPAPAEGRVPVAPDLRFLAEVGTGLWRLRQTLLEPGTDRPLQGMRPAFRHLESAWDALAQAGIQILDHTGAPFDSGMTLRVLAFQPTSGLTREKVLETVKPTIYLRDQPLQMGEVIVGTPAEAHNLPEVAK